MPSTYTPIATTILTTNTASFTFSSIPATYTDLLIVAVQRTVSSASIVGRINGDTGASYSRLTLGGNGSTSQSTAGNNSNYGIWCTFGFADSTSAHTIANIHLLDYATTNKFKQALVLNSNAATGVSYIASTWRNTSAINSIELLTDGGTSFASGTTFTLYGIKAA